MFKKFTLLMALVFGMTVMAQNNNQKVNIQHGKKVISVSINAVDAHLAHGDVVLCDQLGYVWDNVDKTCVPMCDSTIQEYFDETTESCVYDPCRYPSASLLEAVQLSGLHVAQIRTGCNTNCFETKYRFRLTHDAIPSFQYEVDGQILTYDSGSLFYYGNQFGGSYGPKYNAFNNRQPLEVGVRYLSERVGEYAALTILSDSYDYGSQTRLYKVKFEFIQTYTNDCGVTADYPLEYVVTLGVTKQ